MNARKAWILWTVGIIIFGAALVGFAHGAELTDTNSGAGAGWMIGSVGVMALEVYAAVRLNTRK